MCLCIKNEAPSGGLKKEPIEPATSDSALQASFLMHRHILDSTS
ncbi:unnamed protein product [Staurois parvus]|uniref:Uncharacterized protein n=1 Tax=Staurois parvus TaxID=386267 RepID=A0ABN9FWN1_9NEOB|nr:unnamed protein product [Staurois parvus]